MGKAGAQGKLFPLSGTSSKSSTKICRSSVVGLEKPPEIPLLHHCSWDCCCGSFQPVAGSHTTQETDLFCSPGGFTAQKHQDIFCWLQGSAVPGTCYVQFPGAAVSCRDPWPRDGSALRLGQRWEIYIPMGSFLERSLLQPLCCTVLRRPRTKPGGAFLQLQSKRFLSKSSVPILLFLLTVLKLCFFGTREASLLKKRDLTVEQIVPHS